MLQEKYHVPVMKSESIEALEINPDGIYVDATFGGGGHAREILKHLSHQGKLIAFDQDPDVQPMQEQPNFYFIPQNYARLESALNERSLSPVDGILADLGVSSHQLNTAERGFSFRFPQATLDMRMNPQNPISAKDILNNYSTEQLTLVLKNYGEVPKAYYLAKAITNYRTKQPFQLVSQLIDACQQVFSNQKLKEYLPQIFQALRIEVNQELYHLKEFLQQAYRVLKSGGRLVILTYHSLEDRLVKNFLKTGNTDGVPEKDFYGNIQHYWHILTPKPIQPTEEEILQNPRARSAKLRAAVKR